MVSTPEQIFHIAAVDLVGNLESGAIVHCNPDLYIRKGDEQRLIDLKRIALTTNINVDEAGKATGVFQVLEPIVLAPTGEQLNGEEILQIISGNSRCKAIQQQMKMIPSIVTVGDMRVKIVEFLDVPYILLEEPLKDDEIINYQIKTNDHTNPHKPLEIGMMAYKLKNDYLNYYKTAEGGNLNKKQASGKATAAICKMFGISEAAFSQLFSVIEDGTEALREYVDQGTMSADAALTLIQNVKKLASNLEEKAELIDKILQELYQDSWQIQQSKGDTTEDKVRISKGQVTRYFKTKTTTTPASTGKDADDLDDSDSGDGGKEPPTVDQLDDFEKSVQQTLENFYTIDPTEAKDKASPNDVTDLKKAMLSVMSYACDLLPIGDRTLKAFANLRDAFLEELGDTTVLRSSVDSADDIQKMLKLLGKVDKSSTTIKKAIATPPAVVENIDLDSNPI
ncbi:MAG: hypothetical protein ICV68_16395 [Pyrinomonadaceae bacterium]|nr:hypothetical protein [Pyrinomonadaceae bacterium]